MAEMQKAVKVLQARRIFGVNYFAGQVVKNPPDGLVIYATTKVRAQGALLCEFAGGSANNWNKNDIIAKLNGLKIAVPPRATKKQLLALLEQVENPKTAEK